MHRVGSTGNAANAARPRKERRLTYVLRDSNDSKHCSGINTLITTNPYARDGRDGDLFSGSRDGTIRRWELGDEVAVCRATFESHVDWVNDVVLTGDDTLVSCSSDTTIKTWRASSYGECTRTFRQHTDYVTSLAAARHTNVVASGGLGREVFLWDLEAAMKPVARAGSGGAEEAVFDRAHPSSTGPAPVPTSGGPGLDRSNFSSNNAAPPLANPSSGYIPLPAKGHKESVYSLAINESGTVLVSGGTEKAIRVWDPRTGAKQMKLKGHTDNVRALLLDSSERYCLSGSSDSMIRLWDLGQQRCIHSYAVHTDSVWTLAATPSFSHVYSGGRDLSVYLTDLVSRESTLLFMEQHPVQKLALQGGEWLWVATTDSSLHKWPAQEKGQVKSLHRASSFVAGSLPFARARACLEGSAPTPMYSEPHTVISGNAGIVRHAILNDRRHVLTQDTAGVVKLWEITRGAVIADYGKISLDEKDKEMFEMVSVPAWFTMDTRLGSIAIHLDTPNCFSAEMYAVDLQVPNASEELKLNLGQETLRGLLSHWLARRLRSSLSHMPNGDGSHREGRHGENGSVRVAADDAHEDSENHHPHVLPAFEFPSTLAPSIITEGSQGGLWRKKATELDGTDDDKDLPWWCIECVLHNRLPQREYAKCSFYLHPYDGTSLQIHTQGKLSAPRILRIHKVVNYVLEKLIVEKPLDDGGSEGASSSGQSGHQANGHATFRPGLSSRVWQQQVKPVVEILCNNQVLPAEMSLATVRAYVWKKSDDLYLHYRIVPPTR